MMPSRAEAGVRCWPGAYEYLSVRFDGAVSGRPGFLSNWSEYNEGFLAMNNGCDLPFLPGNG